MGKLLLSYYGQRSLSAGQRWRFHVRLKRPWGLANPGSFNYQSWLAQHGYAGTGYVRDEPIELLGSAPDIAWYQLWRQRVTDSIRDHFSDQSERGLLLALSTGDRSAIRARDWERFQHLGLNHLVVISGLHVGLVAGIGFFLGGFVSRTGAHIGAVVLALSYAAVAGFALPTVRALAMLASVQLVSLCGRQLSPLRSLSLALLVVAVLQPLASHSAGFWLSFGAVALIFYLHAQWPGLRPWQFALLMQVSLSLIMGLAASYWFGGVGWLAPLANLIAIPIVSMWIVPLCLLASLLAGLHEPAAVSLWSLAAQPLHGMMALEQWWGDGHSAPWLVFQPELMTLLGILVAVLLLLAHRAVPMKWMSILLLLPLLHNGRELEPRTALEIWVLDVGQGLSLLIRTDEGAMVYDTGAGDPEGPNMASAVLLPLLRQLRIDALDLLVVSHGDLDHAAGAKTLRKALSIAHSYAGDSDEVGGLPAQRCRAGQVLRLGSLQIQVLWPPAEVSKLRSNNLSCVLSVRYQDFRLLLPGDIESRVEYALLRQDRQALAADVLLAPHHGSQTSSSGAFLTAVRPELAIMSRGYQNRFGHPHSSVLERYRRCGITVADTARDGAALIRVDRSGEYTVQYWRKLKRYYWH